MRWKPGKTNRRHRLVRTHLHLPRACRQVYSETRPLVHSYTTLYLLDSELWTGVPPSFGRAVRSFDSVRELFLGRDEMDWLWRMWGYARVDPDLAHYKMAPVFPSLKRLILPQIFAPGRERDGGDAAYIVRDAFSRPDLEIVFDEWPDYLW